MIYPLGLFVVYPSEDPTKICQYCDKEIDLKYI